VSYILSIETALPDNCFSQETFTEFYRRSTDDETEQRKISLVSRRSGIGQRYSVIPDFGAEPGQYEFFEPNRHLFPEPGLERRMALYRRHAASLSAKAIRKIDGFDALKSKITHLITVTCTGLFAPGNDIDLMQQLGLNPSVSRIGINFMGCNAAIIALKQADLICRADPGALVLVVCVELCSIHFQKQYSDDYILSNLIFGDGASAVLLSGMPPADKKPSLKVSRFDSLVADTGYTDMAWQLSEKGFIMNLSSYVPTIIKENIRPMMDALGLVPDAIRYWAVHPGGKRILDDVSSALNLQTEQVSHSYEVLRHFGNMSSPTVLFVLKTLFEKRSDALTGDNIVAVAFGPGLSIETMQLQYV